MTQLRSAISPLTASGAGLDIVTGSGEAVPALAVGAGFGLLLSACRLEPPFQSVSWMLATVEPATNTPTTDAARMTSLVRLPMATQLPKGAFGETRGELG